MADAPPRSPRVRLALPLLALALTGCFPSAKAICGAVLLSTPFVYLAALLVVYVLYREWKVVTPDLTLGSTSHFTALVVLGFAAACGAEHATERLFPGLLFLIAPPMLAGWMILSWVKLPGDWGLRWGGLVAIGALGAPALLGLVDSAHRSDLLGAAIGVWFVGGLFGVVPVVIFVALFIGARRAARRAAEASILAS
jgi:hypothetical protein